MKKLLFLLLVPWTVSAQPNQGGGPFPTPQVNGVAIVASPFTTNALGSISNASLVLSSTTANGNGSVTFGASNRTAGWQPFLDFAIPDDGLFWTFSKSVPSVDPSFATYGNIFFNPVHDGGPNANTVEWQISSSHNIAFGLASGKGSGLFQFGIGYVDNLHSNGGNLMVFQSMGTPTSTLGHSAALTFAAFSAQTNGTLTSQKYPGLLAQVSNTNGPAWEMDIFPDLNNSGGIQQGANQGTWNSLLQLTNGIRAMWNSNTTLEVAIDGKLHVTNDFRTYGSAVFGSTADFGANDVSINHSAHLLSIGNGVDGWLEVIGGGGTRFRCAGFGVNAFPLGGLTIGANQASFQILDVIGNSGTSGTNFCTNGYASFATDTAVTIAATGWTNVMAKSANVYVSSVAVSWIIKNRANATIYTSPTLTTTIPVHLQPGWSVSAASGLSGTALPE